MSINDIFRAIQITVELLVLEPMTQVNGIVYIYNYAGQSFSHIFATPPSFISVMAEWVNSSINFNEKSIFTENFYLQAQKALPITVGHAYMVNNYRLFNIIFEIAKPFFNDEVIQKVHILNSDFSQLHRDIGKNFLEKKYGGSLRNGVSSGKFVYKVAEENKGYFECE